MALDRILLAEPRGFCAGVERAVQVIDLVLEAYDAPIFCRREIVHNRHVVTGFEAKGVTFVEELQEVPDNSTVVFSAHGVSPTVWAEAEARGLTVIDATCPLVTRVHLEVKAFVKKDFTILYIGHAKHDEAVGVMGEAPDSVILVETVEDARSVEVSDASKVVCLTQTTLSVDDTQEIQDVLKSRFADLVVPPKSDICYATSNRQAAVKKLCESVDLVLIVGSGNSSNSNRLVEVARGCGTPSYLISKPEDVESAWLEGVNAIGISSGASTPEVLVDAVVADLKQDGAPEVGAVTVAIEDTVFRLPRELQTT